MVSFGEIAWIARQYSLPRLEIEIGVLRGRAAASHDRNIYFGMCVDADRCRLDRQK